ncbi:polynucleotide kinase-phosphatase [Alienimonas californiensis]|uniref:Bis(5'-nucleosyl)-tetraphosphatase PrpE [asymmetrical] n=1 Tax=Alienimonas californiensis TaxID=2527989 RepID=A0A517PE72_9PLAN|nr:polynucleotide kinase-phosphatase [Alienimonas californiensis]QDT17674.1 Bis(5'-nucleosyl)-tetraphosphatase PrpE [asymmetrical] [Alienimonas californiensis]
MNIELPDLSLVCLVGASGAGKSTFAQRHFRPTEVLSSDAFRGWVADDEADQSATADAFAALFHLAGVRLGRGRLTVIDATHARRADREKAIVLAREHHAVPVAIALAPPVEVCLQRHADRQDREFAARVIRDQSRTVERSLKHLRKEGFRRTWVLREPEQIDAATVERVPLDCRRHADDRGPFDLIGDVHGCREELIELLDALGYQPAGDAGFAHPARRKAVFLGDLCDRGPDSAGVFRTAMAMCGAGHAYAVPGNHDVRLLRALRGRNVHRTHGLEETLTQFDSLPDSERESLGESTVRFIDDLPSHLVLDGGRLVAAHAGLPEVMHGRAGGAAREFCLYGQTTGRLTEEGFPARLDWAADYAGAAAVVHGHVAVNAAVWRNNVLNLDTGCVFGGRLSALRWPEREIVSVPAHRTHSERSSPLPSPFPDDPAGGSLPDAADLLGKSGHETGLMGRITVRAEQSAAALETMARHGVDPRWLVHLPPTMSPCGTARREGFLEHPAEAFADYAAAGVKEVVCEEKHMGSRAMLVVCRDAATAAERFGVTDGSLGECWTRTGRRFFNDPAVHEAFLARVRDAATAAGLWEELASGWLCLDAELLPWNLKADALIRGAFAPTAAAGLAATDAAAEALERATARGVDLADDAARLRGRHDDLLRYRDALRQYVAEANGLDGVRLAPFHLLAHERSVNHTRPHRWHLERLDRLCEADAGLFLRTDRRFLDPSDPAAVEAATAWWEERTAAGGEGMVVKPADFTVREGRKLLQPGVKVRGREYLRLIYGPHYLDPANLKRLRDRSLGRKRGLALREFALGVESLTRFVNREPLRRVHPPVFAVLALESEPVDPRL